MKDVVFDSVVVSHSNGVVLWSHLEALTPKELWTASQRWTAACQINLVQNFKANESLYVTSHVDRPRSVMALGFSFEPIKNQRHASKLLISLTNHCLDGDTPEKLEKRFLALNKPSTSQSAKTASITSNIQRITPKAMEELDYSKIETEAPSDNKDGNEPPNSGEDEFSDEESDYEDFAEPGIMSRLWSRAQQYFLGGAILTEAMIEPILNEFLTQLEARNVAREAAEHLISESGKALVGNKTSKLQSARVRVLEEIEHQLALLLRPPQDRAPCLTWATMEQGIAKKTVAKRVYTIVLCGVNGVGKSTTLAKLCYRLKKKGGCKVMIAGCDTYRSGAIEQLKKHASVLDVELFDRGYGGDAAVVAKMALDAAEAASFDVLLIDTAGRMQDNQPLMINLAKLVGTIKPDAILFVAEALVGNDAIDQFEKFNNALIEKSNTHPPRTIDGVILTKYDTVDEKVGAVISLAYASRKPIVFVGSGQKYTDLKMLNIRTVSDFLLK